MTAPSVCGMSLEYLSDSCTEQEKEAFERHLPQCGSCRAELDELRTVWEALPADMEMIEPPEDLKEQVMNALRTTETGRRGKRTGAYGWRRAALGAASALLIAAVAWNAGLHYGRQDASPSLPSLEEALSAPASSIERLIPLRTLSDGNADNAYGVACIVDVGTAKQFVVYVFGARPTEGEQAYQVWLLRDGIRSSAGTFRVDDRGVGLLAMPVTSAAPDFDTVGITLEPDDRGDRPRGAKAFGAA